MGHTRTFFGVLCGVARQHLTAPLIPGVAGRQLVGWAGWAIAPGARVSFVPLVRKGKKKSKNFFW